MPKVLGERGWEIWLFYYDDVKAAHCYQGDCEVIVDLETGHILGASKPRPGFLTEAQELVSWYRNDLLWKWGEMEKDAPDELDDSNV